MVQDWSLIIHLEKVLEETKIVAIRLSLKCVLVVCTVEGLLDLVGFSKVHSVDLS